MHGDMAWRGIVALAQTGPAGGQDFDEAAFLERISKAGIIFLVYISRSRFRRHVPLPLRV